MTLKVVAKEELNGQTKVFFLNLSEPKPLQLFMMVICNNSIDLLTIYNPNTDTFEDVTALFHPSFLQDLSLQFDDQSPPYMPLVSNRFFSQPQKTFPHSS